jgi:uncharacterized membrane protein HdeD (DUF308 family)
MNRFEDHWGVMGGGLAILAGLVAIFLPGITLAVLVICFGAFAFADGIMLVIMGVRARRAEKKWWVMILQGGLGILAGIATLFVPIATAVALLAVVAAWAIVTGGLEVAAAIRLRREIEGEWLLLLSGVLSVLLGAALVLMPGAGFLALAWMVGAYALSSGIVLLVLAFRLRDRERRAGSLRPRTASA